MQCRSCAHAHLYGVFPSPKTTKYLLQESVNVHLKERTNEEFFLHAFMKIVFPDWWSVYLVISTIYKTLILAKLFQFNLSQLCCVMYIGPTYV